MSFLSGEFFFKIGHPANGGTMIFLRSLWVTFLMFFVALWLRSLFRATWPWSPDPGQLFYNLPETLPWVGAIFAAVYAALYTRFASQWSYLAGEYNLIRQTLATWKPNADNGNHMELWRAGFIEDALALHLATKEMFGPYILRMLDDNQDDPAMRRIRDKFDNNTDNGKELREQLCEQLKDKFPSHAKASLPPNAEAGAASGAGH